MPVKISIEDGKICNDDHGSETVEIWCGLDFDETDCFRLDFIEKIERRVWSTIPDMGDILQAMSNLGFVYS